MAEYEAKHTYTVECPSLDCPSPERVNRDGFHGGKQRYECQGCGKKFIPEGKALRKQFTAEQIAAAIDMYYSGLSYKQVAENMEKFHDVPEPSKHSVHDWVKGYTDLATQYMNGEIGEDGTKETATGKRVKADVGDHWVADELVLRVGGQKYWCWNVMDKETRYILACRLSGRRATNDAIAVFEQAKENALHPPKKITTDGLASYVDAARAVFPRVEHEVSDGIYEPINNNMSERLQGSFRQRTKTQRGLQAKKTGQDYLDGWVIDYNFFKDHHSLGGKTPASVAGIADQVPWWSWEDVTHIGGEVAEPKIKSIEVKPRQPGRRPRPDIDAVRAEVERQMQRRESQNAHVRRSNRRSPVLGYTPTKKPQKTTGGGRGKNEIKATK